MRVVRLGDFYRYFKNGYIQLVAIRRNWIPVPNLQLAKGGVKLVV